MHEIKTVRNVQIPELPFLSYELKWISCFGSGILAKPDTKTMFEPLAVILCLLVVANAANIWKILQDELEIHINETNVLPPNWQDVAPLSTKYFPADQNGSLIVDVWDYMGRMSLYKFLIENVNHCGWDANSRAHDKLYLGNIIWGLPLQHGWQLSSGRLLTQENSTVLTTKSWWADMNYYLSVIPYFGAVEAGLAPNVVLKYNPDEERFCGRSIDCPDIVEPWTSFFALVQQTNNTYCRDNHDSQQDYDVTRFPIAERCDFNLSYIVELHLQSLWKAHIHSIATGLPLFETELASMAKPEADFGRSWAGLVDLIAESLFPCNNSITNLLQNCLPHRILNDGDIAPKIEDMSRLENRAVWLIDQIYIANQKSHGFVESSWVKMMCTEQERALGREMLAFGLYRPALLIEYGLRLFEVSHQVAPNTSCGVFPS